MHTVSAFQSAFLNLFTAYTGPVGGKGTGGPIGIGAAVANAAAAREGTNAPLLYVYGASHAYFATNQVLENNPSSIPPLTIGGFAPGMIELAAVSHLGPALASLVRMQEDGVSDAEKLNRYIAELLHLVDEANTHNTAHAWAKLNPVFDSYAERIAGMIDDGLSLVRIYLERIQKGKTPLSFETLRNELLEPGGQDFPAFNNSMIGTFALANLADHYQVLHWLDQTITDTNSISKTAVLLSGNGGRATAGLTAETNPSFLRLEAWAKSKGHSLKNRIYIAPSGPAFTIPAPENFDWSAIEKKSRMMWWQTEIAVQLSDPMFKNYPSGEISNPVADLFKEADPSMSDFITHLKFALGHATQELASSTSGYILHALLKNGTKPEGIRIPGLSERS